MNNNIVFAVFDYTDTPITGLSLSFTTYKNQDGVSITHPAIREVGSGFYAFIPTFTTANLAISYVIETGNQPELIYDYTRHEDFAIAGLPESPNQLVFTVFNEDYTPAIGQSLTFSTYENDSGIPVTPPSISELGGGFYKFDPVFNIIDTAYAYAVDTDLNPQVIYGYVDEDDFLPPLPPPTPPIPLLSGIITQQSTETLINFGQDTYDLTDLPLIDLQVAGLQNIALRIARRLTTPYGSLAAINDEPDFGYDVFQLMNASLTNNELIQVKADIENECLKDEEIQDVMVDLVLAGNILNITVNLDTAFGPFQLVMNIGDATYSKLQINKI